MHTNTSDKQILYSGEENVIEPQIIEDWGYGFFQHDFHRQISLLYQKLDFELIQDLKENALNPENQTPYNDRLAGQIQNEYFISYENNIELESKFTNFLRKQVVYFYGIEPSVDFQWISWVNISKPGEYNPVHAHDGFFSFVIYLDIPEIIRKEYLYTPSTVASKSLISFYSNFNNSEMKFNPKTGDMFLFTSDHRHAVGAFYTEGVERISLAGNITKL